jgi:hypothetical protein
MNLMEIKRQTTANSQKRHSKAMYKLINEDVPWVVKWGNMIFLVVFCIVIGLSAVIRYPEIVEADISIRTAPDNLQIICVIKHAGNLKQGHNLAIIIKDGNGNAFRLNGTVSGIVTAINGNTRITVAVNIGVAKDINRLFEKGKSYQVNAYLTYGDETVFNRLLAVLSTMSWYRRV